MAISVADFKALNLGYLTGADLLRFGPFPLMASQYDIDNISIQSGVDFAISELISNLVTRYDVAMEVAKSGDDRSLLCVKIASLLSIRNILGNSQHISEKMMADFNWATSTLKAIRAGQMNVPLNQADTTVISNATLVPSSFSTLG